MYILILYTVKVWCGNVLSWMLVHRGLLAYYCKQHHHAHHDNDNQCHLATLVPLSLVLVRSSQLLVCVLHVVVQVRDILVYIGYLFALFFHQRA